MLIYTGEIGQEERRLFCEVPIFFRTLKPTVVL